ncbi:hypothetical protein ACVS9P_02605 [Caproicibacterium sp. NSD3]|nr:hypothetical protein [Caproicibacterium sp. BJN0003]UZT82665.1 hypothetical protein OP489_02305 [Caproicibacterium sp. BJN0003]
MTDLERKALKNLAAIYNKLSDDDKDRLTTFAEGMANVRDRVKQEVA